MQEIENDALRFRMRGEGVLMNAHAWCGCQLATHAVISQSYFIIARLRPFRRMRKTLPIAAIRMILRSWIQLQCARLRHQHDIAQI